ncbi:MAG: hypothetical protein EHM28_01575 [Spirochaetaceae bacterium]|nr:MAG: hypothetical protein EHM28_01575 [Spirochaetaceae bacterium]
MTLVLDNELVVTTAPPGVIIRETAFPEREISKCKILINEIYRGTEFDRVRIAEIEFLSAGQTIPVGESPDCTMIKAFDQHQGLSVPAGKKVILAGRGVFFLYPGGQYASGSAIWKTTGYWAFDPYNLMIYITETIAARVEGTGDSIKPAGQGTVEYFEDYRFREEAIKAGRTIDWLDTIYRGVHLDQPDAVVSFIDPGDWVVYTSDESSPTVENYIKNRQRLYAENRNKSENQ